MKGFISGCSEHTLTPPTYFQGDKTPTPRIYAPGSYDGNCDGRLMRTIKAMMMMMMAVASESG